MIEVVIVDDSAVYRKFLAHSLEMSGKIRVIGLASSGEDAIQLLKECKPRVVIMDIHMPGMDGFETTSRIMNTFPVPVIIISSDYKVSEQAKTFRAIEAGAVTILPKPPGVGASENEQKIAELVTQVRLMSEVKVVRKISLLKTKREPIPESKPLPQDHEAADWGNTLSVIGIGASAGGPVAIAEILQNLNPRFFIPIVIVQHIDPAFLNGFADWLASTTGREVVIAENGKPVSPGKVYLSPPDHNIGFYEPGNFRIEKSPAFRSFRPSVDALFRSMAIVFGKRSLGILLSGMGADGAEALKYLRGSGACTIAQDPDSALINGMPGEAVKINAARLIMAPAEISSFLNGLNNRQL